MGAELSFLMLRLCVILSFFRILGCAGHVKDDAFSTAETPGFGYSVAAPPEGSLSSLSPMSHSSEKAPVMYDTRRLKHVSPAPSELPFQHMAKSWTNSKSSLPEDSYFKHHHHHHHNHHQDHRHQARPQNGKPAAGPLNTHTPISNAQHATEPEHEVSPLQPPYSSPTIQNSPVVASSPSVVRIPIHPPLMSPSSATMELTPPPTLAWALPPPPPNQDCATVTCTEPWTYTPSGFPCGCVWPIQVKLQLNVSLYTFFPLVSELAVEIASSLSLNQSQVRIIGANAARQQPEKTTVLINLVPVEETYTYTAAFSAYEKFWRKQIHVNYSLFGAYDVLGVHYPGLPPSPPSLSSNLAAIDNHPHPASHKDDGGSSLKPLGVAIPRRQKNGSSGRLAAVIIISCITALVTCAAIVWILIASCRCSSACQHEEALHPSTSSYRKSSAGARSLALGSRSLSESLSFSSGMVYVTGYAKIYSLLDIERATGGFDSTRVLGEGGFGVVYKGTFDNGEEVAVKVLKRDTRHGAREFLSEVEMLSRLHHRNLVKLLGICTEDHIRCLVYELVPNGSVESHLHGADKDVAPLDWPTRMTIALGAARGLAYLHEDSSPCVIHRDFKSSNILLEHDFTPKVSDFGLATTALNGGTEPISTQVIGTFGYLAPEYAMTGHLLVKSDVYSYGVVLLELLTGRKPVDFSKPPGQENLVSWALPLLTSNEGLEMIMDTSLRPIFPFDSFTKVAAIASMCVQPEVSRRPFMGEVVQALKLVCSELDSANEEVPRNSSSNQEKVSVGEDSKSGKMSGDFQEFLGTHYPVLGYASSSDAKIASSAVDLVGASARFEDIEIESLQRKCSSGPLGLGRKRPFWQRFGSFYRGSMRERLWPGTH